MSTCKALLSKITNKNAFYEQEDVTQNIFAFRVVGICILFYSFVMILNCPQVILLLLCQFHSLDFPFYRGSGDFYQRLCGGMCAGVDLWIAACEDGA